LRGVGIKEKVAISGLEEVGPKMGIVKKLLFLG
jgi:hypothetical protein